MFIYSVEVTTVLDLEDRSLTSDLEQQPLLNTSIVSPRIADTAVGQEDEPRIFASASSCSTVKILPAHNTSYGT